ncbi:MAG: hypothetical protein HC899_03360 [Leptolyngbyaceae cyanobacterium SM1_4_3]|nr:hypothetical protein [Leptolyngbyaceae cyanobacterium SM1_4_3]
MGDIGTGSIHPGRGDDWMKCDRDFYRTLKICSQVLNTPESSLRRGNRQVVMESELDLLIQRIRRDIQILEDIVKRGESAPTTHTSFPEQDQQVQALWQKLYKDSDEM